MRDFKTEKVLMFGVVTGIIGSLILMYGYSDRINSFLIASQVGWFISIDESQNIFLWLKENFYVIATCSFCYSLLSLIIVAGWMCIVSLVATVLSFNNIFKKS